MRLHELDESMTPVPIAEAIDAVEGSDELAVLPVNDVEHGTACLLIAKRGQLWIVCRSDGGGVAVPPSVTLGSVEWTRVGLGPVGSTGRIPGGLLGGPAATDYLVTVVAGDHLYEAKLHGQSGMEAVEGFVSAALHAGAQDLDL